MRVPAGYLFFIIFTVSDVRLCLTDEVSELASVNVARVQRHAAVARVQRHAAVARERRHAVADHFYCDI